MTHGHACCSHDLDLDPMTLIYELDLDILKMSRLLKLEPKQNAHTQTDTTKRIITPHSWVITTTLTTRITEYSAHLR